MQNGFFGHTEGIEQVSAGLKDTKNRMTEISENCSHTNNPFSHSHTHIQRVSSMSCEQRGELLLLKLVVSIKRSTKGRAWPSYLTINLTIVPQHLINNSNQFYPHASILRNRIYNTDGLFKRFKQAANYTYLKHTEIQTQIKQSGKILLLIQTNTHAEIIICKCKLKQRVHKIHTNTSFVERRQRDDWSKQQYCVQQYTHTHEMMQYLAFEVFPFVRLIIRLSEKHFSFFHNTQIHHTQIQIFKRFCFFLVSILSTQQHKP